MPGVVIPGQVLQMQGIRQAYQINIYTQEITIIGITTGSPSVNNSSMVDSTVMSTRLRKPRHQ